MFDGAPALGVLYALICYGLCYFGVAVTVSVRRLPPDQRAPLAAAIALTFILAVLPILAFLGL